MKEKLAAVKGDSTFPWHNQANRADRGGWYGESRRTAGIHLACRPLPAEEVFLSINLRARKALTLPLMVLAACLILFEDFVWSRITVLVGIISRWQLVARLERWVLARDRTTTLALFAIPISALIPIKLIAVYLILIGLVGLFPNLFTHTI